MTRTVRRICTLLALCCPALVAPFSASGQTPTGACCSSTLSDGVSGRCIVTTSNSCFAGTFRGDGTTCSPNQCDVPEGALGGCCLSTAANQGGCFVSTSSSCADSGGRWQGPRVSCSPGRCTPVGACCLRAPNRGCSLTSRDNCASSLANFLGENTTCSVTSCPLAPTSFACCLNTSTCVQLSSEACAAQGGRVIGLVCATSSCLAFPPSSFAPCCVTDPSTQVQTCSIILRSSCTQLGGISLEAGLSCGPSGECPPPPVPGACCVGRIGSSESCVVATLGACGSRGGTFQGPGSTCAVANCPPAPVFGSCCVVAASTAPGSFCTLATPSQCSFVSGVYGGNGTLCQPTSCTPPAAPSGACCGLTGPRSCAVTSQAACSAAGGQYIGDRSVCSTDPCSPRGACCLPSERRGPNCVFIQESQCTRSGGTYRGDNAVCFPNNPCPMPATGACCTTNRSTGARQCTVTTSRLCGVQGRNGSYRGDGTTCSPTSCVRACPCDWDFSGAISASDLAAFLNDYLIQSADINGDGVTDQLDLAIFTSCFEAPERCGTAPRPGK